ncbi:hypothetical protein BC826DRAFT_1014631 [Russula brevipes]|nr:hypothetical protein BC826DRAFT_1014631 [Russula brevipes]
MRGMCLWLDSFHLSAGFVIEIPSGSSALLPPFFSSQIVAPNDCGWAARQHLPLPSRWSSRVFTFLCVVLF